jgi:predicted metal-dependent hydrolase
MEEATGLRASGWQLRAMTSRWGSCTPTTGRIRLNVRLAAYPPTCLDYVVAHELTHLAEPSHNARFHELLARAYPHERAARALLRQDPRALATTLLEDMPV